jgi:hypothetical protein
VRTRQHRIRPLLVCIGTALLPVVARAHGPVGPEAALAPLDPELFGGWQVWVHLVVQWTHLLGLPLWFGVFVAAGVLRVLALETLLFAGWAVLLLQGVTGAYNLKYGAGIPTTPSLLQWPLVAGYAFGRAYTAPPPGRFLAYSWLWLRVQLLSGVVQMAVATPFALPPYVWNVGVLHHVRFGETYTLLMAIKHGLVLGIVGVTGLLTLWHRAAVRRGDLAKGATTRWLQAADLAMGLAIAWLMIMLLLVHEGVDHAL